MTPERPAASVRPLQHWTPNELVRAVARALPVIGKRRHTAHEALEELRVRALEAPHAADTPERPAAFVVVIPHPSGAEVGSVVGPFPSLKAVAAWAKERPGGEAFIQTKLDDPHSFEVLDRYIGLYVQERGR